eukprot:6256446-Prymnesium_polylepis.1
MGHRASPRVRQREKKNQNWDLTRFFTPKCSRAARETSRHARTYLKRGFHARTEMLFFVLVTLGPVPHCLELCANRALWNWFEWAFMMQKPRCIMEGFVHGCAGSWMLSLDRSVIQQVQIKCDDGYPLCSAYFSRATCNDGRCGACVDNAFQGPCDVCPPGGCHVDVPRNPPPSSPLALPPPTKFLTGFSAHFSTQPVSTTWFLTGLAALML